MINLFQEELREKAIHILKVLAEQADIEDTEYVIVIEDEDGDREEDSGMNTYCEECIDAAVEAYKIENADDLEGKMVSYETFQGCEHDGFLFCEQCGKPIDSGLILDEGELEYWENECPLDPFYSPEQAWILTQILEYHGEFGDRIDKLAQKVIRETGNLPSRKVKTADILWLKCLSPDMLRSWSDGTLPYGFERTIYALQWLGKTLAHDASGYWYPTALRGKQWRQNLFDHFHTFLVQEYGQQYDGGNCTEYHWQTLVERRKKFLVFDRPQHIHIPPVCRWEHEVSESGVTRLLTWYEGKLLTRNPQDTHYTRGNWHWQFGEASLHVYATVISLHIEYFAPEAKGSSWTLQFVKEADETLLAFLIRMEQTLESYIDPNVVTYQWKYLEKRYPEDGLQTIYFQGMSFEECETQCREYFQRCDWYELQEGCEQVEVFQPATQI